MARSVYREDPFEYGTDSEEEGDDGWETEEEDGAEEEVELEVKVAVVGEEEEGWESGIIRTGSVEEGGWGGVEVQREEEEEADASYESEGSEGTVSRPPDLSQLSLLTSAHLQDSFFKPPSGIRFADYDYSKDLVLPLETYTTTPSSTLAPINNLKRDTTFDDSNVKNGKRRKIGDDGAGGISWADSPKVGRRELDLKRARRKSLGGGDVSKENPCALIFSLHEVSHHKQAPSKRERKKWRRRARKTGAVVRSSLQRQTVMDNFKVFTIMALINVISGR